MNNAKSINKIASKVGSTVLAGLPKQLLYRLQSIQNAAAWLVFASLRNDNITLPLLHSLHWLRVAERITFRLAVLTYRCLYGSAPEYMTSSLQSISGIHTRQQLRSASSSDLMVPRTIRSTIGERSFQSAAASTWNALSHSIRSSTSVLQFRSRLKTELFVRVHTSNLTEFVSASVTQHFCSVILKSLDLRHVNDDSNTN